MPTVQISGSTGDEFGFLVYLDSSYPPLTTATVATNLIQAGAGSAQYIGQYHVSSPFVRWTNKQMIQGFDLSALSPDCIILAATMYLREVSPTTADQSMTLLGHKYDWGTTDTAAYLTSAQMAALETSVEGTFIAPSTGNYVALSDGDQQLKDVLVPGEMNRFIFSSARFASATQPTQTQDAFLLYSAETASPPYLEIEYADANAFMGTEF